MSTSSDATPTSVEVRFRIDASEPPLAYPVPTAELDAPGNPGPSLSA